VSVDRPPGVTVDVTDRDDTIPHDGETRTAHDEVEHRST
jgi:hypothetical protein